jgi:hypothetical protein
MTFVDETFINLDNDCLTFTMYHEGDGNAIKPPGGYSIIVGEEEVIKSVVSTEFFSRHRFGNCDQLCTDDESHLRFAFHTLIPSPLQWAIHDSEDSILVKGGPYPDFGVIVEDYCIQSSDCVALKVSGGGCVKPYFPGGLRLNYQIILDDKLVESSDYKATCNKITLLGACDGPEEIGDPLECEEGNEPLRVEVQFEETPGENDSWSIHSCDDQEIVLEGGPYPPTSFETLLVKEACFPTGGCFFMSYIDYGLVSYNVFKNGEQVFARSSYPMGDGEEIFALGECLCDNMVIETAPPTPFPTAPPALFETSPPSDVFTIETAPPTPFETAPPALFETAPPSGVFTIIPGAIENGTQAPTEGFEFPDAISVTEVSTTAPILITPPTESQTPDSGQTNSTEPSA